MPSLRVAVVQFDAKPENVAGNRSKMLELARRARESGARWILFHESAISDYSQRIDRFAETVPGGESTASFIKLARELDCIISFGLSEVENDRYFISQVFVGPQGLLHRYRKTWIWSEPSDRGFRNEWARYDPGTGPEAFEVDGVRATCFICSDGEAPRCVARARDLHPEVVFYPNNRRSMPELDELGELARELDSPMLVANRVGMSWVNSCNGGSVVYDRDGSVLATANREGREEILLHNLVIPRPGRSPRHTVTGKRSPG